MGYPAAILAILASASLAALLAALIRRRVRLELLRHHHEVGTAAFLQLGVIYAVLLAFVFNQVWQEYKAADQAVAIECSSLHGVAILAQTMPEPARSAIGRASVAYARAVTEQEWPAMARGRASAAASDAFRELWQAASRPEPDDAPHATTRAQILSLLTTAHEQRVNRLFQMTQGVPAPLWLLLVLLSMVMVGFVAMASVEYLASVMAFTALFAGALAFILVLVRLLDFPFEGALAISPARFADTLERLRLLFGA